MNTISMTIELCQEDRERLDVISDTLELIRLALAEGKSPATLESTEETETTAPWTAPSADLYDEDGGEVLTKEQGTALPWVTLADVQKKVVDLSTAGKKDAVKALIQEYAPRVSAVPEEKFAEVLEKLIALEG